MRPPLAIGIILSLTTSSALAEVATPLGALSRIPVKELTVFKDGHALVLHAGRMPVNESGDVVMDYLPAPVLGTFWPHSLDPAAKLVATTAGQRRVSVSRTAMNVPELIEANLGATVELVIRVPSGKESATLQHVRGILQSIPTQSPNERELISAQHDDEQLPTPANLVLVKTDHGTRTVNLDQIADVTFTGDVQPKLTREEFRNLLTLDLDWGSKQPNQQANVGMLYVQKGMRWIPNYKISIDGAGNARVQLQATLINELADVQDVTVNLVIGVPNFEFSHTTDPMALQEAIAPLSHYFQQASPTAHGFTNAIMAQTARMSESHAGGSTGGGQRNASAPGVTGSDKAEDTFIFTISHISLKKGQRMVLPVTEFTVPYRDVYSLDIPFTPPPQVLAQSQNQQQAEIVRLLNQPKVIHKIRLTNKSPYPFTTAPALIWLGDRVIGQSMMGYSAVGADGELKLSTAVDVKVQKSDRETDRVPNAANWNGSTFARMNLAGTISLTNFGGKAIEVDVSRFVLGKVDSASNEGVVSSLNLFESIEHMPVGEGTARYPYWWHWYSWPHWWSHLNSVGKIDWKVTLEPGQAQDLKYTWNYLWQ